MGCGSSNQVPPPSNSNWPKKSEYSPKLLLVPSGESSEEDIEQLRYYSLSNCRLEGSLELPSQGKIVRSGFTIAPHPRLPILYVTGGEKGDADLAHSIWTINIKTGHTKLLTSLPVEMKPQMSVVNTTDNQRDFLYIFGGTGQCQRLNITTNNLEAINNPISFVSKLESVLCIQDLLYLIVDEKLIKLDPKVNSKEAWSIVLNSGVPKGHYTVLGDKIVVIDIQNKAVRQCTPKTGSLKSVVEVDCDVVKKSISVIGIGRGHLYFTEPLGSGESVSVNEYNLARNRAATAGFIQGCPVKHKLLICWA